MKSIWATLFTLLVCGCAVFDTADTLRVGMDYDLAEARILEAGGQRTQLLMKGIWKNSFSPSYKFDDGTLMVSYDSTTHAVIDIRITPVQQGMASTAITNSVKKLTIKGAPNKPLPATPQ